MIRSYVTLRSFNYGSQLSLRQTPLGPALAVRLIESQIKRVRKAGTNSRCPFYRGVRLIEVSIKRELDLLTSRAFEREARSYEPGPTTPDQKTKRTTLRKSKRESTVMHSFPSRLRVRL